MTTPSKIENAPAAEAPPPLCWTIAEAARRISLAQVTLRRLIARGLLKRVSGTRRVLISETELQRFVAS